MQIYLTLSPNSCASNRPKKLVTRAAAADEFRDF